MRDRPDLAGCLVRCRHCGIRFFTHPRNAGREDLRCAFGCRKHHRRESSNRRSRKSCSTPEGRWRKKLRNARRSVCAASADVTPSPDVDASPHGSLSPDVDPALHADSARDVSSGHSSEAGTDGSPEMGDEIAMPAAMPSAVGSAERHQPWAPSAETGAEGDRRVPGLVRSDLPAAKPCVADWQHESVDMELRQPKPGRLEIPLEGLLLDEASVRHSPILPYARMVASLIEGRTVGQDELVEALLETMRQRSIDRQTRSQYVLRFLHQHPP